MLEDKVGGWFEDAGIELQQSRSGQSNIRSGKPTVERAGDCLHPRMQLRNAGQEELHNNKIKAVPQARW